MLTSSVIATFLASCVVLNAGGTALGANPEMTPVQFDSAMRHAYDLAEKRNYAEASDVLERAATETSQQGKSTWEATILAYLGSIYRSEGRYTEAEATLKKSINLWTELDGPDSTSLIGPLANLGALYFEAGRYRNAEKLVERALELQLNFHNDDVSVTAMLLTNLGSVYLSEHRNKLAEQKAEEALEKFALIRKPDLEAVRGAARNYALLGAVCLQTYKAAEAEAYLRKAIEIWSTIAGPNDPRRAEAVGNLGIYYSSTGNLEKAEELFQQASEVFQNIGGNNAYMRHFYDEYYGVEMKLGHKKQAKLLAKQLREMANVSAESKLSKDLVDVSSFQVAKK
jgi:tetratricopeptide (TPR) repeat protein